MNRTHFHAFESVWRHVSSPLRQLFIRVTAQSQLPLYQKLGAVWTNWGIIIALDCKSLHPHNKLIWPIIQRGEVKPAFTHWYQENKHQCTKSLTLELLADLEATASDWSATSVEIQMWGKNDFLGKKSGILPDLGWHISWDSSENVFRQQLFSKEKCDVSGKHLKRKKSI